jgi:hypothetical protein
MFGRNLFHRIVVVTGLMLVLGSAAIRAQDTDKRGRKYKAPPPTAHIDVTILRDYNGKPIENASVIFHPMDGERDKGAMELKTNEDGKTMIDVLPLGDTVRLQVIAKGYQTYGEDFKVDKAEMGFEIKMKRPGQQYSIYKQHSSKTDPNQGETKDSTSSDDKSAGSDNGSGDTDSSKDKPADSSSQPSQSQPQPQSN